jgi:hypothetical protein
MALRTIWQFMDRDVTHKIVYGPKRNWGRYTILWVTDRSINCQLARSAMNYLLYYTQYMQICQTTCFCYCISKTKNEFGQNPEEIIVLIGPGQYFRPVNILKYWPVNILKYSPAALTKTNKENKNVKYNILVLNIKGKINKITITSNNVFTLINNKSMGKNDFWDILSSIYLYVTVQNCHIREKKDNNGEQIYIRK